MSFEKHNKKKEPPIGCRLHKNSEMKEWQIIELESGIKLNGDDNSYVLFQKRGLDLTTTRNYLPDILRSCRIAKLPCIIQYITVKMHLTVNKL